MKKLVILLVLLAAAGTAAWLIYRKTPSGPEDKAVLYGNVDLRQVDLAFLISERIDSVLVDEGDTVVPGQKLATLETVRLRQAVPHGLEVSIFFSTSHGERKRQTAYKSCPPFL